MDDVRRMFCRIGIEQRELEIGGKPGSINLRDQKRQVHLDAWMMIGGEEHRVHDLRAIHQIDTDGRKGGGHKTQPADDARSDSE